MNKKGYFVPLDLPTHCNKCVYGCCVYSYPFWSSANISSYDGKIEFAKYKRLHMPNRFDKQS